MGSKKKKKKKKKFWAHLRNHIFLVFWGFQNMRKIVYPHYPLPNFFADQINLEYFMRFFPSTTQVFKEQIYLNYIINIFLDMITDNKGNQ